jgi:hypothetical protein
VENTVEKPGIQAESGRSINVFCDFRLAAPSFRPFFLGDAATLVVILP